MAEQLLNRLITAVETISSNNNLPNTQLDQRQTGPTQSQSAEDAVRRLFPSVDALSRQTTDPNSRYSNASDAVNANRTYVSHVNNFVPSNNYRPVKGKRRQGPNRGQKRKLDAGKSKPPCLKDVILLPSPTIKDVPRGWRRAELYDKNFAISAVEISEGMSESDIRQKLNYAFHHNLLNIPEPKFSFVRAVGNKIINPGCQSYNGKVVKHLSQQGPLYIRSTQDIAVGLDILKTQSADKSDDWDEDQEQEREEEIQKDDDDDILFVSPFNVSASPNHQPSFTVTHSPVHEANMNTSSASYLPATTDTSLSNEESCVITAVMVTCPTCSNSFPTEEIAEHADLCAEAADGGLQSGITYGNLVMQDISITPIEMNIATQENEVTLKECLQNLQEQVRAEQSRLYVRRKMLWQDFVNVTKKCKWFQPTNTLKIVFVGEPAIDGGGPKRELFTETLNQMKIRLFENGVPVASTISLTEGHFQAAGMLMACSIVQGGPAPNFMAPWVFDYVAYGLHQVPVCVDDIKDDSAKKVAKKISSANSDEEMQEIMCEDEVLTVLNSVGYRGVPSRESLGNQEKLIRSICIKELLAPIIPILKDLEEGLQHFGLLFQIKKHPDLFKQLFTPSGQYEITPENFLDNITVKYSQQQLLKNMEEDMFKYFTDFILTLYHEGISEDRDLKLEHVLKFITGANQIPPLGFPSKIKISFLHGCNPDCKCRPTSSTCSLTLSLPIHRCNSDELGDMLISAVRECCGFGGV